MKPAILLVDDEPGTQFGFTKYLSGKGYAVDAASSIAQARASLESRRYDAVLLDLKLPDGNGLDWITDLRREDPEVAVIVITGAGDIPTAVEAMRRGADNFMAKPVNMDDLEVYLRKSLELKALRHGEQSRKRLKSGEAPYFGASQAMAKAVDLATVAAENESPVLLLGETGTGKGVLARWIHDRSQRRSQPFVDVNCSSLRGELLASELFGHAKGAFTSAVQDSPGLIEVAHGGTLFLDEIGDMDIGLQTQFLKVVEEKQYRRVGEVKVRRSDFRLICASNRDLEEAVRRGGFRQDLYFRINVFPIRLPALREAADDIPGLARHILAGLGAPPPDLCEEMLGILRSYPWPGNIRELRNVLERAVLLSRGAPLTPAHLPGLAPPMPATPATWNVDDLELAHARKALKHFGGDMEQASRALGVSKRTLYRRLQGRPKGDESA